MADRVFVLKCKLFWSMLNTQIQTPYGVRGMVNQISIIISPPYINKFQTPYGVRGMVNHFSNSLYFRLFIGNF